jgi:transcriptional regulator with XRE-family HTH domain
LQTDFSGYRDFGPRLVAERKKIGLLGGEMGPQCGVNATSQSAYENGHRLPDAEYLMRAAGLGVDILYVLTGRRELPRDNSQVEEQLSRILTAWPSIPDAARKSLVDLLEALIDR